MREARPSSGRKSTTSWWIFENSAALVVVTVPALRPRGITERVRQALGDTPVVAIVGARQVGKSTLMHHLVETTPDDWTSLTLDDLNVLERAKSDPEGLLASVPGPLAIDEVQRAPGLLLAIKAAVDRDRRPGRFLLSGSADVFALPRYGDALTGRVETATLRPFSQGELSDRHEDFVTSWGGKPPPSGVGRDSLTWLRRASIAPQHAIIKVCDRSCGTRTDCVLDVLLSACS